MVNGEDRRRALPRNATQQAHDGSGTLEIELCCRLVCENDARIVRQRPRYRHPLRLADGQVGRQRSGTVAHVEIVEQFTRAPSRRRTRDTGKIEDEGNIVRRIEKRQQVVEL